MEQNQIVSIFKNEEFGEVRTVKDGDKILFCGSDVAKALGYSNPSKALGDHCKGITKRYIPHPQSQEKQIEMSFITEGDIYRLVARSKLASAERFESWVFDDVIPSIRKTGGYVANEDLFISTYLPHADESTKIFFKATLDTMRKLDKENAELKDEIEYKENIIVGLVEDIDLAEKRQRIVQIIRKGCKTPGMIKARWALLYSEFEKKYHINLSSRLARLKSAEIKNYMDVIDKNMNMIAQLFEICCKIYENDYNALMQTWESTIKSADDISEGDGE